MLSHNPQKQFPGKKLFDTFYNLVKERNQKALETILSNVNAERFKPLKYIYSPFAILALEQDHKSIDYLMGLAFDYRNDVVFGYQLAGNSEKVEEHIRLGGSRNFALLGAVLKRDAIEIEKHLKLGASRKYLALGSALIGDFEQVNKLISSKNRDKVTRFYAISGFIIEVNEQIKKGASCYYVIDGYMVGGYLNRKNIEWLLAYTDNPTLRELLANEVYKDESEKNKILQKAAQANQVLHEVMKNYHLNHEQAASLTVPGMRWWLLHGPQLFREKRYPVELFYNISSYIFPPVLTTRNIQKVFESVHKDVFIGSVGANLLLFKSGKISIEECSGKNKNAEEDFTRRTDGFIFKK